jgi:hypothetical protein
MANFKYRERISSWTPTPNLRLKKDALRRSMQRLVRLLRGDLGARCAGKNAEVITKTGASAICADPANNDTNMKTEMIKPISRQRAWQLRMRASGRCYRCGDIAEPNRAQCLPCAQKTRKNSLEEHRFHSGIPMDQPVREQTKLYRK